MARCQWCCSSLPGRSTDCVNQRKGGWASRAAAPAHHAAGTCTAMLQTCAVDRRPTHIASAYYVLGLEAVRVPHWVVAPSIFPACLGVRVLSEPATRRLTHLKLMPNQRPRSSTIRVYAPGEGGASFSWEARSHVSRVVTKCKRFAQARSMLAPLLLVMIACALIHGSSVVFGSSRLTTTADIDCKQASGHCHCIFCMGAQAMYMHRAE